MMLVLFALLGAVCARPTVEILQARNGNGSAWNSIDHELKLLTHELQLLVSVHQEGIDCFSSENVVRVEGHAAKPSTRFTPADSEPHEQGTTECIAHITLDKVDPPHAILPIHVWMGSAHYETHALASVEFVPKLPSGVFSDDDELALATTLNNMGVEYDAFAEPGERAAILEAAFPSDKSAQHRAEQAWLHHKEHGDHTQPDEWAEYKYVEHPEGYQHPPEPEHSWAEHEGDEDAQRVIKEYLEQERWAAEHAEPDQYAHNGAPDYHIWDHYVEDEAEELDFRSLEEVQAAEEAKLAGDWEHHHHGMEEEVARIVEQQRLGHYDLHPEAERGPQPHEIPHEHEHIYEHPFPTNDEDHEDYHPHMEEEEIREFAHQEEFEHRDEF